MKIEFVNHSSFIVEENGKSVLCDPWLEGSVFNNGWKLLSATLLGYEEFKRIDYIWFSHEHPDHFYPPNIKKIPEQYRKNITILFQVTIDKRVVDWCKKQGFKEVIELYPDKWLKLSNGVEVLCEHYMEGDSWIAFKSPGGEVFLNTNDCGIRNKKHAEAILEKVGKVDLLLTQFSYAYWAGNPDQVAYRRQVADDKLKWMKFQCEIFKPKVIIPIASYVYFSHVENAYLNDEINTARKTYDFLKAANVGEPVILYPAETYAMGDKHDSIASIAKYEKDYERIKSIELYEKTASIAPETLQQVANTFLKDMNENNSFHLKVALKPTTIYVPDYKKAFELSLNGLKEINAAEQDCDASMTSENLAFCLQYPYGLDTTQINGRMRKPAQGNYSRFYNMFRVNQLKSRGTNPNSLGYLTESVGRKVLGKLGLYNTD